MHEVFPKDLLRLAKCQITIDLSTNGAILTKRGELSSTRSLIMHGIFPKDLLLF